MKFIFLFLIFLCACGKTDGGNLQIDSQGGEGIGLPEPSIAGLTPRFKLTELSAVREQFLTINDNIVFTGLKEQMEEQKSLKNVNLAVKSHCLLDEEKVLIKEFNRALNPSIPLMELLPEEVLLYQGDSYPSCGFSFKAENKKGAAHHFELPQLPIMDYAKSRFIKFFSPSMRINESFPYVGMDSIADYWLDLGEQESIDNLSLVCHDFSLSLPIRPQQFIPVSAFLFDQLKEKVRKEINRKRPIQPCRILGYVGKTLTGASYVFYLRYSAPPLYVSIEDDLFEDKESSFYFEFMRPNGMGDKKDRPDVPLYFYSIHNPHPYPVYILIENYSEREGGWLSLDFYGLYHSRNGSFYALHDDSFYLDGVKTIRGQTFQRQTEVGTFIKMEPGSKIAFSVVLKETFGLCWSSSSENGEVHWLGGVVKYPDLKVYQLISDKVESVPLMQNVWQQLDTRAGKGFSILTDHLTSERAVSHFDHLWFRQGICGGKIVSDTNDPIIELYTSGRRVKTRWIDFTPVNYRQYQETDATLNTLMNQGSQ